MLIFFLQHSVVANDIITWYSFTHGNLCVLTCATIDIITWYSFNTGQLVCSDMCYNIVSCYLHHDDCQPMVLYDTTLGYILAWKCTAVLIRICCSVASLSEAPPARLLPSRSHTGVPWPTRVRRKGLPRHEGIKDRWERTRGRTIWGNLDRGKVIHRDLSRFCRPAIIVVLKYVAQGNLGLIGLERYELNQLELCSILNLGWNK